MRKNIFSLFLCFFFTSALISFAPSLFADESITITSYYPSPYGSYNDLYVANTLGVGTTSPQCKFEVVTSNPYNGIRLHSGKDIGTMSLGASSGTLYQFVGGQEGTDTTAQAQGGLAFLSGSSVVSPIIWFYAFDDRNAFQIRKKYWGQTVQNGPVLFLVNGYGNVGIGTTNPNNKLEIDSDSNTNTLGVLNTNTSVSNGVAIQTQTTSAADTPLWVSSGGGSTFGLVVRGNGDVGIGKSVPNTRLHVKGATDVKVMLETLNGATSHWSQSNTSPYNVELFNENAGSLILGTNNAAAMTILSGGYVGIGTTNPGQAKLDVIGLIRAGEYGYFPSAGTGVEIFYQAGSSAGYIFAYDRNSSVPKGLNLGGSGNGLKIASTGAITIPYYGAGAANFDASGNIYSSSDERLKDIQGNFTRGLDEILRINPILYKWKPKSGLETKHIYAGFSAQNVRDFIPDAVFTDPQGYYSLQDRPIMAALVNAVKKLDANITKIAQEDQELKKTDKELKSELENLKTRLSRLEARK